MQEKTSKPKPKPIAPRLSAAEERAQFRRMLDGFDRANRRPRWT